MIFRSLIDRKGWTLIELMVTIGIIGILGALTIPGYLSGMPLRRLKADAIDIASNLKYAKMKAVLENVRNVRLYLNDTGVVVNDLDSDAYCIYLDSNGDGQFSIGDTIFKPNIQLRTGIQIKSNNCTNDTIIFQPNGSANPPSCTVVITNGAEDRRIIINAPTGRIRIER